MVVQLENLCLTIEENEGIILDSNPDQRLDSYLELCIKDLGSNRFIFQFFHEVDFKSHSWRWSMVLREPSVDFA